VDKNYDMISLCYFYSSKEKGNHMTKLIVRDAAGNVIEEKPRGKGRNPAGSWVDKDGNLNVQQKPVKTEVMYVTINPDGSVTKETKGRGRPRNDYVLATGGEHKGNLVKTVTAAPATLATDPASV
jgi:hypothetical protein